MRRLSHRCALCLVVLCLCVACGVPDRPSAAQPPDATPLTADATVAPLPLPPYPPAAVPASPPYPPAALRSLPTAPADDGGALPAVGMTVATATQPPYPPPALTAAAASQETQMTLELLNALFTPTPEPVRTPVAAGPRLREVWPTPARNAPPTQFLYYSERVAEVQTFWRVNLRTLRQRHQLLQVAAAPRDWEPLVGEVAPGGHWIAYLRPENDSTDLHLVRRNGQDDQVLATRVSHVHQRGMRRFAWSPDGRRLAYRYARQLADQHFLTQVFIVDVRGQPQTTLLLETPGLSVIGWRDPTHLLVSIVAAVGQPFQVEAINVETGARTLLATIAFDDFVHAADLSPDGQMLLLSLKHGGTYLLDLATQDQPRLAEVAIRQTVWSADSTLLLKIPWQGDTPAQVFPLAQPATPQPVGLLQAAYTSTTSFQLQGASPDGQYLVLCMRDDMEPRQAQTLLYAVGADRWETLAEGTHCLHVLGWGGDDAG